MAGAIVEQHRVLAELAVETADGQRQRRRIRHVGVEHGSRRRPGLVAAAVDHERRGLPLAFAVDDTTFEVDGQDVVLGDLRPVRAVAIEQEQVVVTGNGEREVVVDPFVEAVERGGAKRRSELALGSDYDIGGDR